MKRFLLFLSALMVITPVFSQGNLDDIVEAEMKAAGKYFNNQEQLKANEFTDNYDLKYHRFFWNIDPAQHYISGSITSYFEPVGGELSEMYFQLTAGFTIDSVIFHQSQQAVSWADNMVHIVFDSPVPENTLDSLTLYYKGVPGSGGFGSFETSSHNGTPVLWTLSEPYGAMDWWPCKQDLNDKIDSIDVYVNTNNSYRAASNGLLVEEIPNGDNIIYHWKHRFPIPAYLVAIAVTNYAYYSDWVPMEEGDDVQVLNYVYPENLESAQNQTPAVIPVMQFYSETFKPYPYRSEKYGHAQFGWGGGMEHTTMSFMGGFSYGLIAHELAHMWFGDDITCGSWEDIWLNEGFATYLTAMSYEFLGDEASWESWKTGAINDVTSQPGGSVKVDDTTQVWRIFSGRLTYRKGALLLHMLRWELGDEAFFQALQNYITDPDLSFGYARTPQLQAHLEAVSGKNLDEFFADWFEGQGYPSHEIVYEQTGDQVQIFVHQEQSHSSVDFFELTLPLKLTGTGGQDTLLRLPLTENDMYFTVEPGFGVTNVVYDPDHWILSKNNSVAVGIDELTRIYGIKLFPNPADNDLNILFSNLPEEVFSYQIIDVAGKTLLQGQLQQVQKQYIDISSLPAGNFKLVLENKRGQATIGFIKSAR